MTKKRTINPATRHSDLLKDHSLSKSGFRLQVFFQCQVAPFADNLSAWWINFCEHCCQEVTRGGPSGAGTSCRRSHSSRTSFSGSSAAAWMVPTGVVDRKNPRTWSAVFGVTPTSLAASQIVNIFLMTRA